MYRPVVWRERNRPGRMAAARPGDIAAAHQAPISGGDTGPGPYRTPELSFGPGGRSAGEPGAARAHRPYRHDERRASRGGGLAAGGRMGPFLHRSKGPDKVQVPWKEE